jgi:hypothetical protein
MVFHDELELQNLRLELTRAEREKENAEDRLKLLAIFDDNLAMLARVQLDLQAAVAAVEALKHKIAVMENTDNKKSEI